MGVSGIGYRVVIMKTTKVKVHDGETTMVFREAEAVLLVRV